MLRATARYYSTAARGITLDTSAYSALMRGRHRRKHEDELLRFLPTPRVRVVPIDEETSVRYALIVAALSRARAPIPANDVWIAASAVQHGLGVFTTDPHYEKVPQIIVERLVIA